jgi:hypothetical protein
MLEKYNRYKVKEKSNRYKQFGNVIDIMHELCEKKLEFQRQLHDMYDDDEEDERVDRYWQVTEVMEKDERDYFYLVHSVWKAELEEISRERRKRGMVPDCGIDLRPLI